jgi:hypothetical protein
MKARSPDDEWPPVLVIVAGVGAFIGAVPWVLFGMFVVASGGVGLLYATSPAIATVCVVLPCLLVVGAVRLMTRRGRWLLICAGLPVTAFAGWMLVGVALGNGPAWQLLALLGPAGAPLLALQPSVGEWLAAERGGVAHSAWSA